MNPVPGARQGSSAGKTGVQRVVDLVKGGQNGDATCVRALIDLFHPEIFRMVYYRSGSRMDAEDLTQEIFMKMANGLSRLKDPERFTGWLYRIAVNRVRDFHRKKRLRLLFLGPALHEGEEIAGNGPDPLEELASKEFWQAFHGMTAKMSHLEREVFTLRYLDQMGIREIAETLKKHESTVKTHLYRALRKFRGSVGLRALLEGSRT
jgi:RNA polymerase sigma-70 factor (ECF subfamily)